MKPCPVCGVKPKPVPPIIEQLKRDSAIILELKRQIPGDLEYLSWFVSSLPDDEDYNTEEGDE